MEVLKQCQKWFEQNEIQKVIAALEAIPSEERTRNWTASWQKPTSPSQR